MYDIPNFMTMLYFYNKGEYRPTDINRMTKLSFSSIIITNKKLLESKYIEVKYTNRKNKTILLTEQGKKIADAITIMFNELGIKQEDFYFKQRYEVEQNGMANERKE
jgi:DNA-binding MarR family transcriptional regulator